MDSENLMPVMFVSIQSVVLLDACQRRSSGTDPEVVAEYVASLERGDIFPPISVVTDGKRHYLTDGYHRYDSCVLAKRTRIAVEVLEEGDETVAVLWSYRANRAHGLRRAPGDLVTSIHGTAERKADWSDTEIAKWVGCSSRYVGMVLRPPDDEPADEPDDKTPPTERPSLRSVGSEDPPDSDATSADRGADDAPDEPPDEPPGPLEVATADGDAVLRPLRDAIRAAASVAKAGREMSSSAAHIGPKLRALAGAYKQNLLLVCPECDGEGCDDCGGLGWIRARSVS